MEEATVEKLNAFISRLEHNISSISRLSADSMNYLLKLASTQFDDAIMLSLSNRAHNVLHAYADQYVLIIPFNGDRWNAALTGKKPFDDMFTSSHMLHRFRPSDLNKVPNGAFVMLPTRFFAMSSRGKRLNINLFTDLLTSFYPQYCLYVCNGLYADVATTHDGFVARDNNNNELFYVHASYSDFSIPSYLFYECDGYSFVPGKQAYPRTYDGDFTPLPQCGRRKRDGSLSYLLDATGNGSRGNIAVNIELLVWLLHFHCCELCRDVSTFRDWCKKQSHT